VEATPENLNKLQGQQASAQHKKDVEKQNAEELKNKLDNKKIIISAKAGTGGRLFGSVTSAQVAQEIEKQYQCKVDKKKIILKSDIKAFGSFSAEIKLYTGISANIAIEVVEA
nr:50S ribosomal protein L9 [Oscillospiraceae bacterium]